MSTAPATANANPSGGGSSDVGAGVRSEFEFFEGGRVQPANVERLRADKDVMNFLSDSRLQAVMRDIDGAKNRERALDTTLERNAAFRAVMERVMETGGWMEAVPPTN